MKAIIVLWLVLALLFIGSAADLPQRDPPTKLGRVSYTNGEVSCLKAHDPSLGAAPASINRIVADGDGLFAGPGARTEVDFGTFFLRLDSDSVASVLLPDQSSARVEFSRGDINIRVQKLQNTDTVEVDLPFGKVSLRLAQAGYYRLHVSPADSALVSVREGRLEIAGLGNPFYIEAHQQLRIAAATLDHSLEPESPSDEFDQFCQSRDQQLFAMSVQPPRPTDDQKSTSQPPAVDDSTGRSNDSPKLFPVYPGPDAISPSDPAQTAVGGSPPLPAEMLGRAEVNDVNGYWDNDSKLGAVWTPRNVDQTWAPFRYGQWNWVDPWGWTWVDDAPWGFATSHYGRWTHYHNRWAWVPGPVLQSRPVYAPALVAFVGSAPGHPQMLAGGSFPVVAWFPLGPGDAYLPPYEASIRHWEAVNFANTSAARGMNIEALYLSTRGGAEMGQHFKQEYVNRKVLYSTTAVTQENFVSGRSLGHARIALSPKDLNSAKVVGMTAAVAPTAQSVMPRPEGVILAVPSEAALTTQRWMLQRSGFKSVPFAEQQQELAARQGRPLDRVTLQALNQRFNATPARYVQPVAVPLANERIVNRPTPAPLPAWQPRNEAPQNTPTRLPAGWGGYVPANKQGSYPTGHPITSYNRDQQRTAGSNTNSTVRTAKPQRPNRKTSPSRTAYRSAPAASRAPAPAAKSK